MTDRPPVERWRRRRERCALCGSTFSLPCTFTHRDGSKYALPVCLACGRGGRCPEHETRDEARP